LSDLIDLSDGKYLGYEICCFYEDWLIMFDGKYNHMLFRLKGRVLSQFKHGRMPYNDFVNQTKIVEYYSNFDNALKGLFSVVDNNMEFKKKSKAM